MHPYYGSDRLVSASPTLIESVELQEMEMPSSPNNGNGAGSGQTSVSPSSLDGLGLGLSTAPVSGAGVLGAQFPLSATSYNPYPSQYQPVPIVSQGTTYASYGSPSRHGSPNGYVPSPYLPVATSTPFVQFATPTTSESVYSYTTKGYAPQVSFHFRNPTFSTPPIQMMAPQAQSESRPTLPWQHTVPTSMPWAVPGTSATNINFTGAGSTETTQTSVYDSSPAPKRLIKRKSTFDDGGVPEKVHVNEERMAARLEEMHLDNNNLQWHPDLEDQWYTQKEVPEDSAGEDTRKDDQAKNRNGSAGDARKSASSCLNFSDILKMGIKSQEILPKLIMDEINKPCMQVVLWKPPGNFVREVIKEVDRSIPTSPTSPSDVTDGMADGPSSTPEDVMETVQVPNPTLSWTPSDKTADSAAYMDDMEL